MTLEIDQEGLPPLTLAVRLLSSLPSCRGTAGVGSKYR
jgi:hypothetical protein